MYIHYTPIIKLVPTPYNSPECYRSPFCDNIVSAYLSLGALATRVPCEMIMEYGFEEEIHYDDGTMKFKYVVVKRMDEGNIKSCQEWEKSDFNNCYKIREMYNKKWLEMNDVREKCEAYMYNGKPLD